MYKQKGGLLLPYKDQKKSQEIFREFINNSESINIISRGTYGLIFKVNLPSEIPSDFVNKDYKQIRPDVNFAKPVNTLLIKLALIYDPVTGISEREFYLGNYGPERITLVTTQSSNFQNEINIQTDVYLKTIQYLQPLCPGIVYANILDTLSGLNFISQMFEKINQRLRELFSGLQIVLANNRDVRLGIIGMQFIENSVTLNSLEMSDKSETRITIANNMARYALLRLALDTGYNHNDFHKANIMIVSDDKYFYYLDGEQDYSILAEGRDFKEHLLDGHKFRAIIIDFGRATKIPPEIMRLIKDAASKGDYKQALKYLCDPRTGNQFVTNRNYNKIYGWVCGDYNTTYLEHGDFDEGIMFSSIAELSHLRESAIHENTLIMDQLHRRDPLKYPLLPVSNSFKNQLYEGMLGGKSKIKKNKTKKRRINKKY